MLWKKFRFLVYSSFRLKSMFDDKLLRDGKMKKRFGISCSLKRTLQFFCDLADEAIKKYWFINLNEMVCLVANHLCTSCTLYRVLDRRRSMFHFNYNELKKWINLFHMHLITLIYLLYSKTNNKNVWEEYNTTWKIHSVMTHNSMTRPILAI